MKVNLPNQITLGRLVIAIVFFALLARVDVLEKQRQTITIDVCIVLFIVAALTDVLDGHLARKYNLVTSFGRVLDPFVDKVLVCGTFVFLASPAFRDLESHQVTSVAPWMVVLILGRELLVTGLRGFSESQGQSFAANIHGKAKMVIQSVTAPTLLFFVAHVDTWEHAASLSWIKVTLVWLTVAATTLSMVSYLYQARRVLADAATS